VVLNTFGSFGDLHPYLGVAIGLRKRGHSVVLATGEIYRQKIEGEGVEFAPVRPNLLPLSTDKHFLARLWHPRKGPEFLFRDVILPALEESYEDLSRASEGADLLVTHAASPAGPILAEKAKLPWLSVALAPSAFFSAYDLPVLGTIPAARHLRRLGPTVARVLIRTAQYVTLAWARDLMKFRVRLGLSPGQHPFFAGLFSPYGTLAMFSRLFAGPQPDWPSQVAITGFPFFDKLGTIKGVDSPSEYWREFLDKGQAPLLFTLGSAAVMHPGAFYHESIQAAHQLGMRAVLLVGGMPHSELPQALPESVCVTSYAPYSELMPKCAAIVHQGGIGTTAQALRSGRPMMVVPWSYDQPDNGDRVRRLGVGITLPRARYACRAAARELGKLLTDHGIARRASNLAAKIRSETGVASACDAIEEALRKYNTSSFGSHIGH
jgi:UDP:flavonoid glycosyltransferase YjiC (YdhE family)